MKFFHTADWHLGKLVQGIYMTEDQEYVLQQFINEVEKEKPDAVIIAGDLYDRAVPPTEAVHLLDKTLEKIVIDLNIPVLAVAGNHDSPGRLHFGSKIMKNNGYYVQGQVNKEVDPIILNDEHGEVHFHLIPYTDPSIIRHLFNDEEIRTHNDAMKKLTQNIVSNLNKTARHVLIGHAFVTPHGEEKENTSDSERPLAIGGAEHVNAGFFKDFHYTALGHLHQAHFVLNESIRYSGSPLKYSISEENHKKGFLIVELDSIGNVSVEKRILTPKRNLRTIEATIAELITHERNDDYVFVRLLDETPVLSPMEKIRSVYPNAMHVERKIPVVQMNQSDSAGKVERHKMDDLTLFKAFYEEVKGSEVSTETEEIFKEILQEFLIEENVLVKPEFKQPVTKK
ncbi:exonuclease SbcCD subunit D [Litchfieldia salsa]|uniref:Nuclease SbcCD subunit D n=1 Tax=Litchfieldia salsa TaxID=930152 RepID=A0A1H0TCY4_9BACI|nr:exonuclease SbcCD subunit D [Litchfieldia salsa]SDP51376.1 Exodeoxyribonuclease I subunit D [Litchfieldia salsa]